LTDLVLVTGATGFVGTALCRTLLDFGMRVRALHRASSNLKNLEGLTVEIFEGDILDRESMDRACHQVRWVFHAASQSDYWRNPETVRQTAIDGTRTVGEAALAAGVERLIFTSSLAAMGVPLKGELLTEDHRFNLPEAQFPYGAAKHQAEVVLQQLVEQGLDAVIVNPTIILGPWDINQISGSMVTEAARGWGFFYTDGGVNFVHILDVAQGHLSAARLGRKGTRYILGGENLSHEEAFTILNEVVGRSRPWLKIPGWIIPPLAWLVDHLPRWVGLPLDGNQLRISIHYLYCDSNPARSALKLDAPRPFRQAVEDAYHWYIQEGILTKAQE
jgi:dihydroflavonol-4-reductase